MSKTKTPLENFFNLPSLIEDDKQNKKEQAPQELVVAPVYDEKDKETESLLDDIRSRALDAHDRILDEADEVDGRSLARLYEVAAGYLDIALKSVDKRSKIKEHKDKLNNSKSAKPSTQITNTNVTINTAELIKELSSDNIIEGEIVSDVKKDINE